MHAVKENVLRDKANSLLICLFGRTFADLVWKGFPEQGEPRLGWDAGPGVLEVLDQIEDFIEGLALARPFSDQSADEPHSPYSPSSGSLIRCGWKTARLRAINPS